MRRRLIVGGMLAGILGVLVVATRLNGPKLLVQYHLHAIERDRNGPEHIASLVRLGRFARPELVRVLKRQSVQQASLNTDGPAYRRCAASAIVLATAYENGDLTPQEFWEFVKVLTPTRLRSFEKPIVPCLLPVDFGLPQYYALTLDGKPSLSITFVETLVVDDSSTLKCSCAQLANITLNGFSLDLSPSLAPQLLLQFRPPGDPWISYVDFTTIGLGRHTLQARFELDWVSSGGRFGDDSERVVFETQKQEFWVVEPKQVRQ